MPFQDEEGHPVGEDALLDAPGEALELLQIAPARLVDLRGLQDIPAVVDQRTDPAPQGDFFGTRWEFFSPLAPVHILWLCAHHHQPVPQFCPFWLILPEIHGYGYTGLRQIPAKNS